MTVTVSSGDAGAVTASPASLTFSTTNYDTVRTVTLSAVQDADGSDESVTVTHGAAGLGSSTLTATVTDDDKGITLSPTSLDVPEGASRTYTVALAAAPSADVTVAASWQGSAAGVTRSPTSLTFTSSNWNAPQTVTVSAPQDADDDNETLTLRHTTSGGGYGTVTANLPVLVEDDENPGLVVAPATLALTEGGSAGTFTVKLGGTPGAGRTTTVTVASGDAGAATVSPATLTFTSAAANWNTNQTVTVTPVQDADGSDESLTVTMTASGGGYAGETGTVAVTVGGRRGGRTRRRRDHRHHRDADDHEPHRRLVLQVHRAVDAPGHLLHGGERDGGERREPGPGHELHLQGVQRRRLQHGGHDEPHRCGAADEARPGDGGDGRSRRNPRAAPCST